MDLTGQPGLREMSQMSEASFSTMDTAGSASDKTPSPGAGSEFLVDEEAASTCPLLTPSPSADKFQISLNGSDHPTSNSCGIKLIQGVAYERQISPSSTDLELSSLPVGSIAPDFGDLNDLSLPPDSSCLVMDGLAVIFPGASGTLESSSSSSSVLHEPTACAQLLNSHHYSHLSGGPDVAGFVCQENGGKAPLSPLQLTLPATAKDYSFMHWNWPAIRRISFFGAMSLIVATACAVIAIMASINTSCKPPHAWWQGTLFYEVFPASFMDSNSDGVGDFRGFLKSVNYMESIGVRAVRMNSIFMSDHYPDHYTHPKDLLTIHPILGTLRDFQVVLNVLHKRNISLVLDLPVDREDALARHTFNDAVLPLDDVMNNTEVYKNNIKIRHDGAVAEAVEFWLRQGVDGFYLKGLEHLVLHENFLNSLIIWRKLADKFGDRILMCSIAALDTLPIDSNLRNLLLTRIDLIDVNLDFFPGDAANGIKTQVDKLLRSRLFRRASNPWIHWNVGSVETSRLASRLRSSNGSLAVLLFNMMLPGTPSIFYGDEIGLQDYNNSEHHEVVHPRQLVPMHWTGGSAMGFTSPHVIPWIFPSPSYSTISEGRQAVIGSMSRLRDENPVIYMNGLPKEGEILPTYEIRYTDGDIVLMERSYPRRHTYIVVSNLGPNVQTRDLSNIYYGGTIMVDLLGRTGQYIKFHSLTLYPGETIMLQLDN